MASVYYDGLKYPFFCVQEPMLLLGPPDSWRGLVRQQKKISLHGRMYISSVQWMEWSSAIALKIPPYFTTVMQVYLAIGCNQHNLTTGIFYAIAIW